MKKIALIVSSVLCFVNIDGMGNESGSIFEFAKKVQGNSVKEKLKKLSEDSFKLRDQLSSPYLSVCLQDDRLRKLLQTFLYETGRPSFFLVNSSDTKEVFRFVDKSPNSDDKLNYFCTASDSDYEFINKGISDVADKKLFIKNIINILKDKINLQGQAALQKLSAKFGSIIKVSEYLRSLSAPTIAYALMYKLKHEANEEKFNEKFNDMFPGQRELRDIDQVIKDEKIGDKKNSIWLFEKFLNIENAKHNKKTTDEINRVIDALRKKGITLEKCDYDMRIKVNRANTTEIIGSSLIFIDKGGAEKIRLVPPGYICDCIKSMLYYSPVYNEFAILPQDVQDRLAESFYSDKLDTLNYIIYGKHVKATHTFKSEVIYALKMKYWDEYSCDYIISLRFGCLD